MLRATVSYELVMELVVRTSVCDDLGISSSSGSGIQPHGLRSNLGKNKCGSSIGAYCVDNLGVSLYPASQKEKVAVSSSDYGIQSYGSCSNLGDNSSYGSFVADVGSQPYGLCGSFVNDGSGNSTGAYSLGYGCSVGTGPVRGIVLDFENSIVRLPSVK
ncbi:hypothetical protein Tco_0635908 [Tanacetum coccineum]